MTPTKPVHTSGKVRGTYHFLLLDFLRTMLDATLAENRTFLRSQLQPDLDGAIYAAERWPDMPWIPAYFLERTLVLMEGRSGLRLLREELEFAISEFEGTQ